MAKQRLWECHFLIPLCRDRDISDGAVHDPDAWDWLHDELRERFTAWTKAPGRYTGEWKSKATGAVSADQSIMYLVAVLPSRLRELRSILRRACVAFGQQCIYLSVKGVVELVEAEP